MGEPEPVDLLVEIRAVLDTLELQLRDHIVDVEMPRIKVQADTEVLRRTLTRLVAEVAARSQPGCSITIRTSRRARGGEDRAGSARQQMAQIEVGEEREETPDGEAWDDLGLVGVAEDVQTLGGEFGVSSAPGRTPTFWFTVPLPSGTSGAPDA